MDKEFTTTEAERRAKQKWQEENREKTRIYNYRSQAKKFIKDFAEEDDLKELEKLIKERRKNL